MTGRRDSRSVFALADFYFVCFEDVLFVSGVTVQITLFHNYIGLIEMDLKVTSWNVRGIAKITKLKKVFTRIKQFHSIVFIQE